MMTSGHIFRAVLCGEGRQRFLLCHLAWRGHAECADHATVLGVLVQRCSMRLSVKVASWLAPVLHSWVRKDTTGTLSPYLKCRFSLECTITFCAGTARVCTSTGCKTTVSFDTPAPRFANTSDGSWASGTWLYYAPKTAHMYIALCSHAPYRYHTTSHCIRYRFYVLYVRAEATQTDGVAPRLYFVQSVTRMRLPG